MQGVKAQTLQTPDVHPKFQVELPKPAKFDACSVVDMYMRETTQDLGLKDTDGNPLTTTVRGYGPGGDYGSNGVSFPGPTLEARSFEEANIRWNNDLPNAHLNLSDAHLLPVDMSLHMAAPNFGIPTVVHLHGGHTESASDGQTEGWYTQGWSEVGPDHSKQVYHYDNGRPHGPGGVFWRFHDR